MIKKIKEIYKKYDLGFYLSLLGFFIMGTAHLILTIINFTWFTLNYTLFCYIMLIARYVMRILFKKDKSKHIYIVSVAFLTLLLIPLTMAMIDVLYKNKEPFNPIEFFIYAYAAYAFLKISLSINNFIKYKSADNEKKILCWYSIIAALFTMFMLEHSMITIFTDTFRQELFIVESAFLAAIIGFVFFTIIWYLVTYFKDKKKNSHR